MVHVVDAFIQMYKYVKSIIIINKKRGDGKSEADATQRNKERCICMNEKVFFL